MAIRITRVYTRTGDRGETSLVGGKRVPKDSPRIAAYGTIDELNAVLGLARVFNAEQKAKSEAARKLDGLLTLLQNRLFDLGSELATPREAEYEGMFHVGEAEVRETEKLIDEYNEELEELRSFILPGGGRVGGFLHVSRTICRRAERDILALSRKEKISQWPLMYVNRLSDLLFVLSRWIGKHLGEEEYLWGRGLEPHRKKTQKKR
ncbi:MAG: cob(I)yrinic acid a,c-diamide adenosyltransferase [Vicinamibacteria bacterium]